MTIGHQKSPAAPPPFLRNSKGPAPLSPRRGEPGDKSFATGANSIGNEMPPFVKTAKGWTQFCALALNIDSPTDSPPFDAIDQLVMNFINQAMETHGAIGGIWKDRLYLCALPDVDIHSATQVAEAFASQLATQRPETVSIGIAPYPLLTYDRQHTWNNTCKALDHGAFLGPGSIVPLDAVSLNISGDRLYHLGEIDSAIAEYSTALELDPNNTNVRNSLGVCFAELDDRAAAESEFKLVTEIDPAEPMAWYNLGMLSRMNDQDEVALAYLENAFATRCDLYEISYQIGRLLSEQCRWKEALEFAEQAAELNREHWASHSLMGLCLAALDRIPEAINAYTKSVRRNPNNPWDLSALGCLYDAKDENPDVCRTFLEQSVALAPQNGLFHNRLGKWHEKHQQFEEAMAAYRQASAWGHDATRQIESIQDVLQVDTDPVSFGTG